MIKLYTDQSFLTETYRRQVFPLLFDLVYKKNEDLLLFYKIVDKVEDADIIVFPIDYSQFIKHKEAFHSLLQLAKTNNKTIWIYTAGDYGFTNYISNSHTFRLGGFNSKLSDATFVIPSFINDPYLEQLPQGFSTLKKEKQPSIGFVGHAKSGAPKYVKEYVNHLKYSIKRALKKLLADRQTFYPSSIKRSHYLLKLSDNKDLNTQFIFRDSYRAGAITKEQQQTSTQLFYDNMFNTAYNFCIRGVGNFSVRFYETLAVGRIPILLNTDCRLPFSDSINWKKHCVMLDENSEMSLEQQIIDFHNNLNENEFESLQKSNRDLWLNHLKRESYFKEIYNQFKSKSDV